MRGWPSRLPLAKTKVFPFPSPTRGGLGRGGKGARGWIFRIRQQHLGNNYDSLTYPHSIGLEGYQPISQVSDNDRHILNDCVSNYQARVGN